MQSYDDVNAKCPFYNHTDRNAIYCEGLSDNSCISLRFHSTEGHDLVKEKNLYKKAYCDCQYEQCRLFKMLEGKYEEI